MITFYVNMHDLDENSARYWAAMPEWLVDDAAVLLLGKNPKSIGGELTYAVDATNVDNLILNGPARDALHLGMKSKQMYDLIRANIDVGRLQATEKYSDCNSFALVVQPHELLAWARKVKLDIPRQLSLALLQDKEAIADSIYLFRRESRTSWTINFDGVTLAGIPDSAGISYISMLISNPLKDIAVNELIEARTGECLPTSDCDMDEILDESARKAYKTRLQELIVERQEAIDASDYGRQDAINIEFEFIESELERAMGLGYRPRRVSGEHEKQRKSASIAIKRAIESLEKMEIEKKLPAPAISAHFKENIRPGISCKYIGTINWTVEM